MEVTNMPAMGNDTKLSHKTANVNSVDLRKGRYNEEARERTDLSISIGDKRAKAR